MGSIKAMNEEALKIHEAKKLGIVPTDHPEYTTLTIVELDELGRRQVSCEPDI